MQVWTGSEPAGSLTQAGQDSCREQEWSTVLPPCLKFSIQDPCLNVNPHLRLFPATRRTLSQNDF